MGGGPVQPERKSRLCWPMETRFLFDDARRRHQRRFNPRLRRREAENQLHKMGLTFALLRPIHGPHRNRFG